jgi:hypothetical protein
MVKPLVEAGANLNENDQEGEGTPLFSLLACKDNLVLIDLLLSLESDTEIRGREGQDPLLISCCCDRTQIVESLVASKANVSALGSSQKLSLHLGLFRRSFGDRQPPDQQRCQCESLEQIWMECAGLCCSQQKDRGCDSSLVTRMSGECGEQPPQNGSDHGL